MQPDSGDFDIPDDVERFSAFKKVDGAEYDRVNDLLRERVQFTAREWAIARLCAEFRTDTGVEMTKIGRHLPALVPFMDDTYTPQAVNQARKAFDDKIRLAMATALYGTMADFYTADELDDVMYEATEVAKFLLEVEGADPDLDTEQQAEQELREFMREVRRSAEALKHDAAACPHCGEQLPTDDDEGDDE